MRRTRGRSYDSRGLGDRRGNRTIRDMKEGREKWVDVGWEATRFTGIRKNVTDVLLLSFLYVIRRKIKNERKKIPRTRKVIDQTTN